MSQAESNSSVDLFPTNAVVRVGYGRGFVVDYDDDYGDHRIIITAGHCLPFFPPCHPAAYLHEQTYQSLLGPLGAEPTVWAQCLFVDPIADVAVLGSPDNQALYDQADAYEALVAAASPLMIADAPAQGRERTELGIPGAPDTWIDVPTPGRGPVRVLSLKGRWIEMEVERRGSLLSIEPVKSVVSGMSGSPILSETGAAIGLVSVDMMSPVLVDSLPARLLREIGRADAANKTSTA